MVVGIHDGLTLHRSRSADRDSRYPQPAHAGICKATADCTLAPVNALGDGWIRSEYLDRHSRFYRHAELLRVRCRFLAKDAGLVASRIKRRGVLLDRCFPERGASRTG